MCCWEAREAKGLRSLSGVSLCCLGGMRPSACREVPSVLSLAELRLSLLVAVVEERLSRRFCSLLAMYSLTSASDCGPTEMVRLRVLESIAGISDAGGRTLSSLRRGGTLL